jgi:F-type H+-transporting ATPase subunit b
VESFSWHVLLAQVATFLIGAAALWLIAFKPIKRVLGERRRRIEGEFRAASEAREQAEAGERALHRKLSGLEEDAREKSRQVEANLAKLREEMRRDARAQAREILDRARSQMRQERGQMQSQLRREIARLAVGMARKVTGKLLTREDHGKIIKRVIGELPRAMESRRMRRRRKGT